MRRIFITVTTIGLVFALGFFVAGASQAAGYDTLTALLYADVAPAPLGNTGYFQTAMLGGLYAGWSVTMLIVATDEALWRHPRTWTAILVGLLVWFVLDGAGPEVGESHIELPIGYAGDKIEITLDPRFLIDFLKTLDAEQSFTIDLVDSDSAAVALTDDGYTYVLMPLARDRS